MKNILKLILEQIWYILFSVNDSKKIVKIIDNYEYISFDIFDTLIKRKVNKPNDIFDIIEEKYNDLNHSNHTFKSDRLQAYKRCKKNSKYEEITLKEIYNNLNNYTDEERQELYKLEILTEYDNCIQNAKMYHIYNECIKKNKKILFTSDMYLDEDSIRKILKKNNYTEYELYLSSTERMTKKSGNLFKKILYDKKISKKEIVHIGDSPINDFIGPSKNGIKSILIRRK